MEMIQNRDHPFTFSVGELREKRLFDLLKYLSRNYF